METAVQKIRRFSDLGNGDFLFRDGQYSVGYEQVKNVKAEKNGTITFNGSVNVDPDSTATNGGGVFSDISEAYIAVIGGLNRIENEYKLFQMRVESAYMDLPRTETEIHNKPFSMLKTGDKVYRLSRMNRAVGIETEEVTRVDTVDGILYVNDVCILNPKSCAYSVMLGKRLFSNADSCYKYAMDMLNSIYSGLDSFRRELEILYERTKRNNNNPITFDYYEF